MTRLRRILLVDDSPVFLAAAVSLLPASEGIEVVGTAGSGREALERVAVLKPDLVLMDLAMPDMNGLEAISRIAAMPDRPRVILMTGYVERAYRAAALRVGADGVLQKADLNEQLLPLIRDLLPRGGEGSGPATDAPSSPVAVRLGLEAGSATGGKRRTTETRSACRCREGETLGDLPEPQGQCQ